MANQFAKQDQNQFPALIAHTGTAGTAETVRLTSSDGALNVDLVGTEPVVVQIGTVSVGTLNTLGTVSKLESGSIAVVAGTIASVGTVPGIGTISDIKKVHTAGTVMALPDLPGGTVDKVSDAVVTSGSIVVTAGTVVTAMGDLTGGTIDKVTEITGGSIVVTAGTVETTIGDITGGTIDLLTAGTITKVEGGSIVVTAGTVETTIGDLTGGTIDKITSVDNIVKGTLHTLGTVAKVESGSIAVVAGTIASVGTIPGLGTISNIAVVHNAGTVAGLPDLPGGTVDKVTSVDNVVKGTLHTLGTVAKVESGSIAVVAGTIGAFTADIPGGTIDNVGTVVGLGTIANIAKIHNAGTVVSVGTVPGVGTISNIAKIHNAGSIAAIVPGSAATQLGKAEDEAHTSGDVGVMMLGVRKDSLDTIASADGDYTPFLFGDHGGVHMEAQHIKPLDGFEDATGWTVLNVDTTNLGTTANHVSGSCALKFDKINGDAGATIAGIQKTITEFKCCHYVEGGGFILVPFYISSTANVDYVFVRLGTDGSNYNEYRLSNDDDTFVAGWNLARLTFTKPTTYVGTGIISSAVTYFALGIGFDDEANELADIVVDRTTLNSGLQTSADITAQISSDVSSPNVIVRTWGNAVDTDDGDSGSNTLRVVLASDQPAIPTVNTVGTVVGLGTIANIAKVHNAGTVASVGTIPGVGTISNIAQVHNAGTVQVLKAGTVSRVEQGSIQITAGTIGTVADVKLIHTIGTLPNLPQGSINVTAGTIASVGTVPGLGTISNIAKVHTAGTVMALPDLPGGTVDLVTGVTTVSNLTSGSVRMTVGTVTVLPDLPGGTVDVVTNVAGGTLVSNTPYSYKYQAAAGANVVVKNSAGFLHAIMVGDAVGTSIIEVSDNASDGDGAVVIYMAGDDLGPALYPVNMTMGTGITADITSQTHVTFIYK